MKRKLLKIIALIIAITLIIGISITANSLVGNPISKMLAKNAADAYLAEHFPGTDYYVLDLGFSFKFVGYYAHIRSQSSMDTQFSLRIDMLGNVNYDTYDSVTMGFVTAERVNQEYRKLTDQIFERPSFPYRDGICYGHLEIQSRQALEDPNVHIPEYTLWYEDFILDHIYDPKEMGMQAGCLTVYVDSNVITFEEAARIMLFIRTEFDSAVIPFRTIDFMLQYPLPEEGSRPDDHIWVEAFPYEDIYEEGLIDRIKTAHEALETYYAAQDEKYK